jgi:hypothetical protein
VLNVVGDSLEGATTAGELVNVGVVAGLIVVDARTVGTIDAIRSGTDGGIMGETIGPIDVGDREGVVVVPGTSVAYDGESVPRLEDTGCRVSMGLDELAGLAGARDNTLGAGCADTAGAPLVAVGVKLAN